MGRSGSRTSRLRTCPPMSGNVQRDSRNAGELRRAGWRVFTIWECETREEERLEALAEEILEG